MLGVARKGICRNWAGGRSHAVSAFAFCLLLLGAFARDGRAASAESVDIGPRFGPFFLGHETEPSMDYGGRTIASLHTAACDLGWKLSRRMPYLAPAYEAPLAILFSRCSTKFMAMARAAENTA